MKRFVALLFCVVALASDPLPGSTVHLFALGDSKTVGTPGWLASLIAGIDESGYVTAAEAPPRDAVAGRTVAQAAAAIDADLATRTETPEVVLVNLGVNDLMNAWLYPSVWSGQFGYVLDAVHAKWPGAQVFVARVWARTFPQAVIDYADGTVIPQVIAARSPWCFPGIDERVCLAGTDNGYTFTTDGVHLNAAGFASEATAWMGVLGIVPQPNP